jgi:sugar transferase (PEP-CTERM/EpsH1 system associated)
MNAGIEQRARETRPLIAHIVFRFDVGGLENGLVNLVNALPADEFRHAIIALSEATSFKERIRRADVSVHALGKRPGKDPAAYWRLLRLLRTLRPAIVHTRNLGTLDCTFIAWLAGVKTRVHGEHGWDIFDPDGTNPRYRRLRRALGRLIARFVAVSRDLEGWLIERVGIPARKVVRICNGVDTERFSPPPAGTKSLPEARFPAGAVLVGSVTRFEEIKDPLNLVRAFIRARAQTRAAGIDLRLVMLGDGPLRPVALAALAAAGESESAWLPGAATAVAPTLRALDFFVLGSRREGISNTVLEAMATGLPVIASATGGNLELVVPDVTGRLVPPGDTEALAASIAGYAVDAALRARHGAAARARAVDEYSLTRMVGQYRDLYRAVSGRTGVAA